jgi:hypothetical protein
MEAQSDAILVGPPTEEVRHRHHNHYEYCDWPNLYFLWLQGIDAKLSATGDKM